ncbi:hypothetical protein GSI_02118 [Ganoderma sinense ZZ0214-1]|uniref:Hydrophobin n=1 Tax=Ganoderma sinense ZZ0214-1 TaxID=1077348 RepID=A0A2G8SNR0_9APHY|nr:hypothetical protein GSI_02118 [Ganoderma sinense ZZ0214-1]
MHLKRPLERRAPHRLLCLYRSTNTQLCSPPLSTMTSRILALVVALLPVLGGAASLAARDTCDGGTGTLLCCDLLASPNDPIVAPILASLGIPASSLDEPVGVTCTPLNSTQAQCPTQRACCTDNDFNGVVALDCTEA